MDVLVETDVLIVGSGPAGSAAALCLSTLGVDNIMITKYRWTANTPRAHITNQRAMEIFRDLGIEADVWAQATPHELMGETVFCTSIATVIGPTPPGTGVKKDAASVASRGLTSPISV